MSDGASQYHDEAYRSCDARSDHHDGLLFYQNEALQYCDEAFEH